MSYIYKLKSMNPEVKEFYIGSTIQKLKKRIDAHKTNYNKNMNSKVYNYIRDNGGWDTWTYEIIQEHTTTDLRKLRDIENEYCIILKPKLNSIKSFIPDKDKETYYKNYMSIYRRKNKLKKLG